MLAKNSGMSLTISPITFEKTETKTEEKTQSYMKIPPLQIDKIE